MEAFTHIENQLKKLIKEKGFTQESFIKMFGSVGYGAFKKSFSEQTLRLRDYIHYCESLEVDPASLFPGMELQHNKSKYTLLLEEHLEILRASCRTV